MKLWDKQKANLMVRLSREKHQMVNERVRKRASQLDYQRDILTMKEKEREKRRN